MTCVVAAKTHFQCHWLVGIEQCLARLDQDTISAHDLAINVRARFALLIGINPEELAGFEPRQQIAFGQIYFCKRDKDSKQSWSPRMAKLQCNGPKHSGNRTSVREGR